MVFMPGAEKPFALVQARGGITFWWTHEGWVDTPTFVDYIYGGEPGAKPIDPNDLEAWQNAIPKPSAGQVALMRSRPGEADEPPAGDK